MRFDGDHQPSAALPRPGTVIGGKFRLERYLAEGGMSVIAVGRHVQLDEPIALKFLKPEVIAADDTATVAGRFVREARATIKIRSEHVPRIFDIATLDAGIPYIVMELLAGEDLEQRLERDGPLPVPFVVDVMLQVLEALAAAHALGIVHRDLKPANIFLSTRLDGTLCAKVLDFGIAKLIDQPGQGKDHGLTTTNAVMGSPRYMSPEQMRGTRDVDARADVWAIGTTIYEVLAGVAAFEGENLTQVCAAVLQDEPDSLTSRRPDVPADLDAVVRRCLSKRAADRYPDVGALAAALAPFGSTASSVDAAARVSRVVSSSGVGSSPTIGLAEGAGRSSSSAVGGGTLSMGTPAPGTPPLSAPNMSARTDTSWGTHGGAGLARRRRHWTTIAVVVAGAVGAALIGGTVLLRARSPVAGGALAPPSAIAAEVPSSPEPVAVPKAAPTATATATAASEPPAATATATGTAPKAPATPHGAKPSATEAKPTAPEPPPMPTTTASAPKAPSTPTNTSGPKPPSKPRTDLWDDRK